MKITVIFIADNVMGAAVAAFTMEGNAKLQVEANQSRAVIFFPPGLRFRTEYRSDLSIIFMINP